MSATPIGLQDALEAAEREAASEPPDYYTRLFDAIERHSGQRIEIDVRTEQP